MKLSKTSEYAVRILSFMAINSEKSYSAKELVEKLQVSDKYLRRIMTNLTKAGLIFSTQGRNGGYSFAKSIDQISIADIIDVIDGIDKYTGCILGFEKCDDENPCTMHNIWNSMRNDLLKIFNETKLSNLKQEKIFKY